MYTESPYKTFDDALKALAPDIEGERTFLPLMPDHMRIQAQLSTSEAKFLFAVYSHIDVEQQCSVPACHIAGDNAARYVKKLTDLGLLVKTNNKKLRLPPIPAETKWVRVPKRWFTDLGGLVVTDMQILLYVMQFTIPEVNLSQADYANDIGVSRSTVSKRPSEFWKLYRGNAYVDNNQFKQTATRFDVVQMMRSMNTEKKVAITPPTRQATAFFAPEQVAPVPCAKPAQSSPPKRDFAKLARESNDPDVLRECIATRDSSIIYYLYMNRASKPREIWGAIEAAFVKI